jgi:hypothetical protein
MKNSEVGSAKRWPESVVSKQFVRSVFALFGSAFKKTEPNQTGFIKNKLN